MGELRLQTAAAAWTPVKKQTVQQRRTSSGEVDAELRKQWRAQGREQPAAASLSRTKLTGNGYLFLSHSHSLLHTLSLSPTAHSLSLSSTQSPDGSQAVTPTRCVSDKEIMEVGSSDQGVEEEEKDRIWKGEK
ncbi:hypothetical protein M9H77_03649 [Catharanthus roseus]|uniref:Uncharacterized protein n=1 Tax=Catharanthus roseus TaxID=4058 RepID=A0ACC0CCB5_CATRO|nr:hypothetical protein M9H77_03649 [Catharanthus roseus]